MAQAAGVLHHPARMVGTTDPDDVAIEVQGDGVPEDSRFDRPLRVQIHGGTDDDPATSPTSKKVAFVDLFGGHLDENETRRNPGKVGKSS